MTVNLEIPEEELKQFQSFLHIYSKGKVIVQEGSTQDQKIFLLRQGEVEVFKNVGDQRQLLGKIEAVNLFGEMAIITHRPRTATVIAASDNVVIYAFDNPNLSAILANPKWGGMLVRRLVDDLEERHNEFESAQLQSKRYQNAMSDLVGAIMTLYAAAGTNEESKQMFLEALPRLVGAHMQGLGVTLRIPDKYKLKQYQRLGIISEYLYQQSVVTRSKLKDDASNINLKSQ